MCEIISNYFFWRVPKGAVLPFNLFPVTRCACLSPCAFVLGVIITGLSQDAPLHRLKTVIFSFFVFLTATGDYALVTAVKEPRLEPPAIQVCS